jgi:hypothetical protein
MMRQLMVACPDCFRTHKFDLTPQRNSIGGINCACGTQMEFQIVQPKGLAARRSPLATKGVNDEHKPEPG